MRPLSRRRFLGETARATGALWLGCSGASRRRPPAGADGGPECDRGRAPDPFAGGTHLGDVPFVTDRTEPLDTAFGAGLDGRLYTDLSTLEPEALITPNDRFYVRTRLPDRINRIRTDRSHLVCRISGPTPSPSRPGTKMRNCSSIRA